MKVKSLSRVGEGLAEAEIPLRLQKVLEISSHVRIREEFGSPGDLPDPGIEPGSPALQADALPSEPPGKTFFASREAN